MKNNSSVLTVTLGILSVSLGLLSFPSGSRWLPNVVGISFVLGFAAFNIACAVFIKQSKKPSECGVLSTWSAKIIIFGVLLAVALGNVSRPMLTLTFASIAILVGTFVNRTKEKPKGYELAHSYAITGIILGLQGMTFFFYSRIPHYHYTASLAQNDVAAAARIDDGRTMQHGFNGHSVDLHNYYNTALNASFFHNRLYNDSLANLPSGYQIFGGIPFDVSGVIILSGQTAIKYGCNYPPKVDIKVVGKCQKLYFLDSVCAENGDNQDTNVGTITLKYEDGSEWRTALTLKSNITSRFGLAGEKLSDEASELVWIGSNGITRISAKTAPWLKLRICKTTVINPHPELNINSLTFESNMLKPSPFLVALTVE